MVIRRQHGSAEAPREGDSEAVGQRDATLKRLQSSSGLPKRRRQVVPLPDANQPQILHCLTRNDLTARTEKHVTDLAQINGVSDTLMGRIKKDAGDDFRPRLAAQVGDHRTGIKDVNHGSALRFSSSISSAFAAAKAWLEVGT